MMNNQETKYLEEISKSEDEKLEKAKKVNQLEQEIQESEGRRSSSKF